MNWVCFLSLHYSHCLWDSDVAGSGGACGEMWQSGARTQDPRCAGNVLCTDVLMHTCWGILRCETMLSLLKLSIAPLITNATALFVIPGLEVLRGCHGRGSCLCYSGSSRALFYWKTESGRLSILLWKEGVYEQYLSSIFRLHSRVHQRQMSLMHRGPFRANLYFPLVAPLHLLLSVSVSVCNAHTSPTFYGVSEFKKTSGFGTQQDALTLCHSQEPTAL